MKKFKGQDVKSAEKLGKLGIWYGAPSQIQREIMQELETFVFDEMNTPWVYVKHPPFTSQFPIYFSRIQDNKTLLLNSLGELMIKESSEIKLLSLQDVKKILKLLNFE